MATRKDNVPSQPPPAEKDATRTERDCKARISVIHPPAMIFYNFLRSLKLQVLAQVSKRVVPTEPPKICLHKNHRIAVLHGLVHLIPLAGAISLLFLNWTQYYVGPEFSSSTTVQFLAKFHELLMQTSITECILHIIRYQAIHEFLPLGGFSALLQTFHISYLWSLDFWSTITSKRFNRRRKALFITTVPLLIILTTVVGPSSAILMIPRQGTPKVVDTQYGKATASLEEMFPGKVDISNGLGRNPNAFYHDFTSAIEGRETEIGTYHDMGNLGIPRIGQIRPMKASITDNDTLPLNWATATIATQFIAQELVMYRNLISPTWRNTTVSVEFLRPVVTVGCITVITENIPGHLIPYFKGDEKSGILGLEVPGLVASNFTDESLFEPIKPFWISPPDPSLASIIGIFPIHETCDRSHTLTGNGIGCLHIQSCTISAFWEASRCMISSNEGPYSVQVDSILEVGAGRRVQQTPITMDLNGIPTFNSANVTYQATNEAAAFLASGFALALSEIPSWDTYHLNPTSYNPYSRFAFETTQYGYGYNISTTSVRLSMSVITIYCIVTISYIMYTLLTGSTSTAWNSPIEFLLLALKSKQPHHLGYTSVGIDSVNTYREEVGIRVNECDELELVFDRDPDLSTRNLTHVRPNVSY